ncbi:MAG: aspartate-semialdehyde dehydrogenase [Armatimonadetes bacterium]|nr:aspartate-semialdehyde dehydrogenase [Armatimonadota bacterium]
MSKYKVAVVGAGAVGEEMVRVLRQRNFPMSELVILARSARKQTIEGIEYDVKETTAEAFEGLDIAFFAGTEGAKGASQVFGWEAVARGAFVVDNGDDFRMDPRVPLVVPEVNGDAMANHQGFIANPNCSTIQMVHALAPLHKLAGMKRVVVSTYQSVSGTGSAAIKELEQQLQDYAAGNEIKHEQYPYQILNNLIPQISGLKSEYKGYYGEEIKMIKETRKIFGIDDLAVSATCVRVPVFRAHSETVNVEFEKPITAHQAREALAAWPGIEVVDDPANGKYPMPLFAEGTDLTFVGRIRQDSCNPNTLDMWVVADNIRKGAALNAVQIAEMAIERGFIKGCVPNIG